jgi:hypothetical protein
MQCLGVIEYLCSSFGGPFNPAKIDNKFLAVTYLLFMIWTAVAARGIKLDYNSS